MAPKPARPFQPSSPSRARRRSARMGNGGFFADAGLARFFPAGFGATSGSSSSEGRVSGPWSRGGGLGSVPLSGCRTSVPSPDTDGSAGAGAGTGGGTGGGGRGACPFASADQNSAQSGAWRRNALIRAPRDGAGTSALLHELSHETSHETSHARHGQRRWTRARGLAREW